MTVQQEIGDHARDLGHGADTAALMVVSLTLPAKAESVAIARREAAALAARLNSLSTRSTT